MIDIYIPSYHRPNNLMTCQYFQRIGYDMSKLTVFVDNESDDIAEYRKACDEYGCNLYVFDMSEARRRYDYVHRPAKSRRSAGQARNMFHDYAKAHNVDFYCVIDDDTSNYQVRVMGYDNYRHPATLEDILWHMNETEQFMRSRHIGVFAWSQTGDFMNPCNIN